MAAVRKFAVFCHRWMGVAFCLLFTWWFVSGAFMMYCDFPAVRDADRMAHAPVLDASRIRVSPEQAYKALGFDFAPDQVHLIMFDGRPAYCFGAEQSIVYADDGTAQKDFPAELTLRTAAAWAGAPTSGAAVEEVREPDQWTVGDGLIEQLPLVKYSWAGGQQVYVSPVSGQVVQYTTRWSRLGGYLGPVAHWLYFTPLRKKAALWTSIVIWASGIATVMALSGLLVGLLVYSPSKRYRFEGAATSIPYAGTKRLHMIFGLFFGIVACTWAFSGMLSMEPFPIQLAGREGVLDPIGQALRGQSIELSRFSERLPGDALASAPASLRVKDLELLSFAGEPAYIAFENPWKSWVVPVRGEGSAVFANDRIVDAIGNAVAPARLTEVRNVTEYEDYYLDRGDKLPLPVLFAQVTGAGPYSVKTKGENSAGYYIDPHTLKVVGRRNTRGWFNRWLYHGLHSLDFPLLYNYRPAWDILVLLLLAGGTTLSVTSAILGWKLLRRKIAI
jgi:hypothetical protein